jgi:hypothetical protein
LRNCCINILHFKEYFLRLLLIPGKMRAKYHIMISSSEQKKYLDKILNSTEFAGSKIYNSYLTYLVEATENQKSLKEITIAIEVFGKDANFNPAEDTIVRSHTYNLRKKLESYYHSEGREDKYRLKIPKGHYEVAFVPATEEEAFSAGRFLKTIRKQYQLFIIVFLCILLAFSWSRYRTIESELQKYRIIDPADPIWKDYLLSELPVLIVVGDHFFFNEYSEKYQYVIGIRHAKINSPEDLEELKAKYPDANLQQTDEPYFPYHSIWSLPPLLSLFFSVNQKPILRKSSSLSPQMLDEYNMIFVGSIKTLYILRHTLAKTHFQFEITPHKIIYTPSDSGSTKYFETSLHSAGPNEDLVLALKLPGPVGNSIFIIASFHSLGAPEIANYLVESSKRQQLEEMFRQKFNCVPKYFEILFRVTGIDKTAYSTEILIYDRIDEE